MKSVRPRAARLVHEAAAGVVQKSSRSLLAIVGTALGIGSFIAVLGVTSTANGQIVKAFDETTATQIAVQPVAASAQGSTPVFPAGVETSVLRIQGAIAAGRWWDVSATNVSALPPEVDQAGPQIRVLAASADYWSLAPPKLYAGRVFDDSLDKASVAVIGLPIARALHLANLKDRPLIYIDGHAVSVIGVVSDAAGLNSSLSSVTIPAGYADNVFGDPGGSQTLAISSRPGAGQVVAEQVAIAIDPVHPEAFRVLAPPRPAIARDRVDQSVQTLFLALALICLLVGAVGITNASLIGVLARAPEIGLRRSLGALPRHIAAQFLIEAAIRGLLGGAAGAAAGLSVVVIVAITQQWSAVVEPWTVVGAPLVGAVVGLFAGLYPAHRASRIEPIEALRR